MEDKNIAMKNTKIPVLKQEPKGMTTKNPRDSARNQHKLMKIYTAELAGLDKRYG